MSDNAKLIAALDKIEGFARRNRDRANAALLDARNSGDRDEMLKAEARSHEAGRLYGCVKYAVMEGKS